MARCSPAERDYGVSITPPASFGLGVAMSCDDMYVCERGIVLPSCRIKIMMRKCDKFDIVEDYVEFLKKLKEEK